VSQIRTHTWSVSALAHKPIPTLPTCRYVATSLRRYVKLREAAEYLQVTERTIRQMIADGRLRGYRSGSRLVRVDLNEIDAAMQPFGGWSMSTERESRPAGSVAQQPSAARQLAALLDVLSKRSVRGGRLFAIKTMSQPARGGRPDAG
jgi:excisionase family DNA binding protein